MNRRSVEVQRGAAPGPELRHELVLVGGGHSHVAVVRRFGMCPVPGLRVTLLSRDVHTPYSGMLPGLLAGHYEFDDCHIDLRPLCEAAGVRLIHAEVSGLDRERRLVHLKGRPSLPYDWLSLNIGSRPALREIPGACEHGVAVKPIDRFLEHVRELLERLAGTPRACRILVVGAGAAGVEIALACDFRARRELGERANQVRITLVSAADGILETHNRRVQRHFLRLLERRGIEVHCGERVQAAVAGGLVLSSGAVIEGDEIVWAIHAGAPEWPRASGLSCDPRGFVRVDAELRSVDDPRIFAAGDIAALPVPVPKSGVYAVRAGRALERNLRRVALGQPPRPYRPQRRFLSLLSTGDRRAVASRGVLFAAGAWAWRWKDHIDRKFMRMYRAEALAPRAVEELPGMRCGGCAAKVGSDSLGRVMAALSPYPSEEVVSGLREADDAAVIAPPAGRRLVQSVDYFRAFIDDPYLFGRIAALHCIGDVVAMGAEPHSAMAVATIPYAAPSVMESTLAQLMQGALETLLHERTALIGGHSNEGAELAFGLSVNGFADAASLLPKSGLVDGQCLVLGKALGTGVLLAANMAVAAQGRWIDAALESMLLSPSPAMRLLRRFGATACTDVTGFGLLGHLREMLRASALGAELYPDALPALPGALESFEAGYRSSLYDSNRGQFAGIVNADALESSPVADLMLDPQTAGGLLAALPAERAADCVAALNAAGYRDACVVGRVSATVPTGMVVIV